MTVPAAGASPGRDVGGDGRRCCADITEATTRRVGAVDARCRGYANGHKTLALTLGANRDSHSPSSGVTECSHLDFRRIGLD